MEEEFIVAGDAKGPFGFFDGRRIRNKQPASRHTNRIQPKGSAKLNREQCGNPQIDTQTNH